MLEEGLFFFACLLAGIGALGRAWCGVFISGRKDATLVRKGPYAMCRNPLYFFSMLGAVGVGMATETLSIPAVVLLMYAIYYPIVIRSEEKYLAERFGEDFDTYCHEVPCFFPRFSLLRGNEPGDYPVCTRTLRHNLFDTLWFVWLVGLIELLSALQDVGWLPVWWTLY
ncbi:MAG: isoprenylcysteine carboxylmethyltransferase family protein [Planctomycetia bacterium]|nr:isoprenylcysteine carboxylmethyltransferase family protein [Planctomycetia bacterium]